MGNVMELCGSLYLAVEQANFLLHRIWIHVLKSKVHPLVKKFSMVPGPIEVEEYPNEWTPESDERRGTSDDRRRRKVTVNVLAVDGDSLAGYLLTLTLHLRFHPHDAPMYSHWTCDSVTDASMTPVSGGLREVDISQWVYGRANDCMDDHTFIGESESNCYEKAKEYFS